MRKIAFLAAVIPLLGGVALGDELDWPVPPALETITVDAGGTVVPSTTILEEGEQYWILAEGTYQFGSGSEFIADAEWSWDVYDPPGWYEEREDDSNLDLVINDLSSDWWGSALADPDPFDDFGTFGPHTFSPSHKYWLPITGEGTAISLHIADSHYDDNSGSLTASIYQVPEPTTLSLLVIFGGLVAGRRRRS